MLETKWLFWAVIFGVINQPIQAEQRLVGFGFDPSGAYIGASGAVNVTVRAESDSDLINDDVLLEEVEASGKLIATIGRLYDDGTNGDKVANDLTFTRRMEFDTSRFSHRYFRASATYKGNPQRVYSGITDFLVMRELTKEEIISENALLKDAGCVYYTVQALFCRANHAEISSYKVAQSATIAWLLQREIVAWVRPDPPFGIVIAYKSGTMSGFDGGPSWLMHYLK